MGRQKTLKLKGKEESPEKVLNEIEANKLLDTEFKIKLITMLKELIKNYKELHKSCKELPGNEHQNEK